MKSNQKKIENFWYYHSIHVAILVFLLLIVGYFVFQKMSVKKYDYAVAYVASKQLSYEDEATIKKTFENYADDYNGDGKTNIQVISYVFSGDEDVQKDGASSIRLMGDLELGKFSSCIYDQSQKDFLEKNQLVKKQDEVSKKLEKKSAMKNLSFAKVNWSRVDKDKQSSHQKNFLNKELVMSVK